jgi:hypothetical protein
MTLFRYAWELNPFVYALSGELGYRRYNNGAGAGLVGLEVDLALPIGRRLAVGFTPAAWRVAFGGDHTGSEITTNFLRIDYVIDSRFALTLHGPLEIDWRRPKAELSFGIGVAWALTSPKFAGGPLIEHHSDRVERVDETWSPPQAPYGRLKGRTASWYVGTGVTTVQTPAESHGGPAVREGQSERWSCGTATAGEASFSGRPAARSRSAPGGPSGTRPT